MNRIEQIEFEISKRRGKLDESITIVDPDSHIDSTTQADWMINLLEKTYHKHGISQNPTSVREQIDAGNLTSWFALKNEEPIAVASLITQADGSVEIGRAVSLERGSGIGGTLMLQAGLTHFKEMKTPLVAEVRVSDTYEGIPSGEATQKISLGHLGLLPHALVPAFHHGEPDRQEQFVFSTSDPIVVFEALVIPADKNSQNLINSSAIPLAKSVLGNDTVIYRDYGEAQQGWILDFVAPFAKLSVGHGNIGLQTVVSEAEKYSPFALIPLEMSPPMASVIVECLNSGFVPCGIARETGINGHPVLLLGKLRKGVLLSPIKLLLDIFSKQQINAINIIDDEFRKNI